MASPVPSTSHCVEVRRVIPATPARVYEAWTNPVMLAAWFAPTAEHRVIVHEADARVGGTYCLEMVHPNGGRNTATGEYRELIPGRRLVFTWRWAEREGMDDTLVTVDLRPDGAHTEVVLVHTLFHTEQDAANHEKGWIGCLSRLQTVQ